MGGVPQAEQELILARRGKRGGIDIARQQSKVVGGKLEANLLGRGVAYQHFGPVVGARLGADVSAKGGVRAEVVDALEVAVGPNTPSLLVWITSVSEQILVQVVGSQGIVAGGDRDAGVVRPGVIVQYIYRNQPAVSRLIPLYDGVAEKTAALGAGATDSGGCPKRTDWHSWGQSNAGRLVKHRTG